MRTSSPISTISYNTDMFLIKTLNSLVDERYVDFWAFIQHLPEDDCKSPHKHLYIVPAKLLDSAIFNDRLEEPDLLNPDKPPLGCKWFQSSKFINWYLYVLHDVEYLASIGQVRKYHYEKSSIFCNDIDYMNECYARADVSKYKRMTNFQELISSGVSFRELVKNGHVPIQQIIQWRKAYNLLRYGKMDFDDNRYYSEHYADEFGSGGDEGATCAPLKPSRPRPKSIFGAVDEFEHTGMYPIYGQPFPFGEEYFDSSESPQNPSDNLKN